MCTSPRYIWPQYIESLRYSANASAVDDYIFHVSNRRHLDCLLKRLFGRRSKKTSKLRATGLCEGNSPVIGGFPSQRASNAENVPIWWRHHFIHKVHAVSCFVTDEFAHISFRFISENGITIFQGTTKIEHHFIVSTYHLLHRYDMIIFQSVKKLIRKAELESPACTQFSDWQTLLHSCYLWLICSSLSYKLTGPYPKCEKWMRLVCSMVRIFGYRREINHKCQPPTHPMLDIYVVLFSLRNTYTDMCFWTRFSCKLFNIWKNDPSIQKKNKKQKTLQKGII